MSFGASPQMSNYPYGFANGISIRNLPLTLTQGGQVFWVSNNTLLPVGVRPGSDSNPGTFQAPFASVAGALAACVAGRGDVIMVKPGHYEVITATNLLNINKAGVAIVGLGGGTNRPEFVFETSTAATVTISANDVTVSNLRFITNIDALDAQITITGVDVTISECVLVIGTSGSQAVLGISATAAANRLRILNSFLRADTSTAGTTAAIQLVGGTESQIIGNYIAGAFTAGTGCISNITTAASMLQIIGNQLYNLTAASTKVITAVAGASGFISNNRMQILSGTAPITAAGMSWVGGNYYANAVATAGTLI